MYSYEERIRVVRQYIQYDHSIAAVIRELGYPSHQALLKWYKEYRENGDLHDVQRRTHKFTEEQKETAIRYYWEHGRCLSRATKALGYPSRQMLAKWIDESDRPRRNVVFQRLLWYNYLKNKKCKP